MRILHLLNHTQRLNGHVHAAVDLACAQAQLGNDVVVCSAGGDFDALLAANGVEVVKIDQARRPATVVRAIHALIRLVGRGAFDVVHAHMMTSALLAWPACRLAGVPLVTTVHNEFQRSSILMGIGERVIAVSGAVARSLVARGIPASRTRMVLNGTIGAARFADANPPPLQLSRPSVLFVGGLHHRKGLSDLITAFGIVHRTCAAANLTIVGEGPHRTDYELQAVHEACAEVVTFAGAQQDPRPYLLGADVFVLPSHADPAPLVLSEARAAGCAVIATRVDGIPELLNGGAAGILVPPRDPAALAAAILSLVDNPAALASWRLNSQIDIEHLSIARVAKDTLAVYGECVISPTRQRARNWVNASVGQRVRDAVVRHSMKEKA